MSLLCEVCKENDFKYKCPKCFKKTCSLQCAKDHKANDNCTGEKYNSLEYYSSETLKSADDAKHESNHLVQRDFNFLNNMKREFELHKRDGKLKNKRILQTATSYNSNANKRPRYNNDISTVGDAQGAGCNRIIRRGVNCLLLPRGMQRSLQNKSKWDKPLDLFVWTLEWVLFPKKDSYQENTSNTFTHLSHRIKETDALVESMGKIIFDKCCDLYDITRTKTRDELLVSDTKQERTKLLISSGLKFYTKWFPYNTNSVMDSRQLIELEPTGKCIGEIFRNKTVIEFPTIFIALGNNDIPGKYEIIKIDQILNQNDIHSNINRGNCSSLYSNDDDIEGNDAPEESSSKNNPKLPHSSVLSPTSETNASKDFIPQQATTPNVHNPLITKSQIFNHLPTATGNSEDDTDSDDYDPGVNLDFLA